MLANSDQHPWEVFLMRLQNRAAEVLTRFLRGEISSAECLEDPDWLAQVKVDEINVWHQN
jgi:hypothetical protein